MSGQTTLHVGEHWHGQAGPAGDDEGVADHTTKASEAPREGSEGKRVAAARLPLKSLSTNNYRSAATETLSQHTPH
eukprot:4448341-Pyramimonas_sp.AAC.1